MDTKLEAACAVLAEAPGPVVPRRVVFAASSAASSSLSAADFFAGPLARPRYETLPNEWAAFWQKVREHCPRPACPPDPLARQTADEILSPILGGAKWHHRIGREFCGWFGAEMAAWAGGDAGAWVAMAEELVRESDLDDFRFEFGAPERERPRGLVGDWLAPGDCCLLAGPKKSCKTIVAAELAGCLAAGRPFLGLPVPEPTGAVCLTLETDPDVFRAHLRSRAPAGRADEVIRKVVVTNNRAAVTSGQNRLLRMFEFGAVRVVVLDPTYLMMGGVNHLDIIDVGKALDKLTQWARTAGAAVVIVHHAVKALNPGDWMTLSDINGAGFSEYARSWMLINRDSAYDGSGLHTLRAEFGARGFFARRVVTVDERDGLVITHEEAEADDSTPAKKGRRR